MAAIVTLAPRCLFSRCLFRPTARRRLSAAALLFVLAAQWLALVHTVVHSRGLSAPTTASAPGLMRLVAGHDAGTAACVLMDQLAQATPVFGADPPPVVPPPAPPAPVALREIQRGAATAAYQARAPPAARG